jgi:class 3 adenylate cyclase
VAQLVDRVESGRAAFAERDWARAYGLLTEAEQEHPLTAEDFELLARAAFWADNPVRAIPIYERAYARHLEAGNRRRAAFIAVDLAHEYGSVKMQRSVGNGWLNRAVRLLAEEPDAPENGYLALERSLLAINRGDYAEALAQGKIAEELGRRHHDRSLEVRGLQRQGMALIEQGEFERGRALLDEAAVAALGGELDPFSTIVVYCNTIGACRDTAAFDQAGEWTERVSAYCDEQGINSFPGMCRVNRAEVMRFTGKLAEAEETAEQAWEELAPWAPRIAAAALYEIGEVRLRLGDLAKAEEAFDQADDAGRDPEPGRSLLLLARGRVPAALASIRRALNDDLHGLPSRARMLPALVEIAVAANELDEASAAAAELKTIAERYGTPALLAATEQAEGSVRLASGQAESALGPFRRSLRLWQEANASYDAARTRLLLGQAYRQTGDEHGATHELAAAAAVFDRLGARLDSERAAQLLGRNVGTRVTKTFLFTDIVDSTRTLEAVGDEKWARALRWHDETLLTIFRTNGGEVVHHTGDGFFVAFESPDEAVGAAVAIQRAIDAQPLAPEVRVGIHADEATSVGANYHGKGVHVAARIGGLAGPAEIVASKATVEGQSSVSASEPRLAQLKGLSEPVEVVSLHWRA